MGDAIFKIPTPQMLSKLVDMIDTLPMTADTKGDLYEYLLSKVWIVNTKLNNFFKGVLTVLNWR